MIFVVPVIILLGLQSITGMEIPLLLALFNFVNIFSTTCKSRTNEADLMNQLIGPESEVAFTRPNWDQAHLVD